MLLQYIIKAETPQDIEAQARKALEEGVNWIEIFAPEDMDDTTVKGIVEKLRPALAEKGAVLILAERPELAKEVEADGVHVYSTAERPVSAVRVAVDAWPIIGVSVYSLQDVVALRSSDIDYMYYCADGTPESLETLYEMAHWLDMEAVDKPLVVGGDVSGANVEMYVQKGAAAVATSRLDDVPALLHFTANLVQENV